MKNSTRRRIVIELAIVAILVAVTTWSTVVEPNMLRITETVVANGKWPADRRPLTVVALADLHIGSPHIDLAKLAEVVRMTNALKPELILLLGDYINMSNRFGNIVPPDLIAEPLANLSAPLGI